MNSAAGVTTFTASEQKKNNMNKEDIQNLTPAQIEAIVCQLEHQHEQLQEKCLQKKTEFVNYLTLLRNRMVIDDVMKKLKD